jgi:threonyl-tRNA synthetase
MLVIGDKEVDQGAVALRLRAGENPGPMQVDEFIERAKREIKEKV